LQDYLDRWAAETDHGGRKGPLEYEEDSTELELTGADVFWLAWRLHSEDSLQVIVGPPEKIFIGSASSLHLELASLRGAHLEGAELIQVHLEEADLYGVHLDGAFLISAHLEDAYLGNAVLDNADLSWAESERANFAEARLQKTDLHGAKRRGANFSQAQLQGANLGAAQLEGTNLSKAQLQNVSLHGVSLDKTSRLNNAILRGVSLDQATFDNTNLSVVDWKQAPILGDELTAQAAKDTDGKRKSRQLRIAEYQAAVRAYRRLAVALQANGLSAEAANYLYRASIMERRLARHERRAGAYFFSVLLAVLAGYGYRLGRIVVAYITVVAAFALAFLAARYFAGTLIDWVQVGEAAQISLNAIHGRVFFAQLSIDSAQSCIATIESVVGIVIEGVFVAMLIQRFFGR
jgi:uncharacterized protein YjbI with pentapeptide repeats